LADPLEHLVNPTPESHMIELWQKREEHSAPLARVELRHVPPQCQ
jgi:hypothetical protein